MEIKKVCDCFGNELQCGDFVCFVGNPKADWRQTKYLVRVQIKALISTKSCELILYDEDFPKVAADRVAKCY